METLFLLLNLIVLVDEGKLSNLYSGSNIIKSCNRIIFPFFFSGLSFECIEGLRPHNSGSNYKVEKKFSDCGIADDTEINYCEESQSCRVVDVWIKGINDRPLTIPICGPKFRMIDVEPIEPKDRDCEAICEKKRVDAWKTTLTQFLKTYAKEKVKLTDDCLKILTDIEAITVDDCFEEKCNEQYCKGIKSIPGKDCQKNPPKMTEAPVENESPTQKIASPTQKIASPMTAMTEPPAENKSSTKNNPSPITKVPAENKSSTATSVTDTNANDKTGNATTGGQAKNVDNVKYMLFLVFTILFNFLH